MTTNLEILQGLDAVDFAQKVVFDSDGNMRASCAICQRHIDENCDDNCFGGVVDYLEKEVGENED